MIFRCYFNIMTVLLFDGRLEYMYPVAYPLYPNIYDKVLLIISYFETTFRIYPQLSTDHIGFENLIRNQVEY